ncbi:putative nicotinic acid mononucleotide adenylyltransferase [Vibrio nigripulchritudo SFn27]|nr:nicotinate-nicotinamide nucleotide adenylyltransferase [Vibrio nigripulchritudo]CCN84417.1 putative nicotinic acid mononucleotide adenylyltransferase [Vibrio nigripulchritudo BLFn1]CCN86466.1 putative nicotinic acid mononucleotide adenylyltransferase [Vibrio nigripulchritudo SFn27]CCN97007.1 putative nicotinic acid mononucleotide adenylyltransferase [Vibrio nigripulchritudo ENn2]CCO41633.1 putative nicotinic acid mononucleotide adenylyltransferase [Vibrio nigripulchritudo SFn135]CCO49903.1 
MMKIAIFGSAFNPPTLGHKSVIESLTHFDKVLLLPSYAHAWGKEMVDFDFRCQMVEQFISDLAQNNLELCSVEAEMYVPGESVTTFAVLTKIQEIYPDADITFVVGPDNFFQFSKFYRSEEIVKKWTVMACPEKVSIRSTLIREKLAQNESVSALTTSSVNNFLLNHNLYQKI